MIDYFALALTHGLLLLGAWRMLQRADLDREEPAQPDRPAAPESAGHNQPRPKPELRTRA